ncbi:MAG: enoyl-CoA hydratase/isomerase family protein [Bacteroidota bacterium]
MPFERILYNTSNRTATITLNRPEKRNALDDVMVKELIAAFTSASRDQNVKVIVLEGTGTSFCAGADLAYLSKIAQYDLEQNIADSNQLASLFRLMYELRKPVIAVVNGPALAGGCGLAGVCDMVIASKEHATFGYTEVRIGFIPAIVMIFLVKRIGQGRARELILRGNIISASEAKELGLVNMVVPEAELVTRTQQLISELLENNSLMSMGLCKEMLSKLDGMNLVDALDYAAKMNASARMTPECKRGMTAFLNKEKIQW